MNKVWIAIFTVILILTGSAFMAFYYHQSGSVILEFHARVGDKTLEFSQPLYPNPGGKGRFSIRAFQVYLSDIHLVGSKQDYQVSDSYHLARFDNETRRYRIELSDVPYDEYTDVMISIGVDEEANSSLMPRGDLDPNGRMAWSWEVGYKFLLFEGGLEQENSRLPLVYHVGFSENLKKQRFNLPKTITPGSGRIHFDVDVLALFDSHQSIDMATLPSVKFDRNDASLLAENYANLLSLSVKENHNPAEN